MNSDHSGRYTQPANKRMQVGAMSRQGVGAMSELLSCKFVKEIIDKN